MNDFGTLVNNAAMGTEIRLCGVRADIMLPETSDVGGLASTLGNESGITASSYMGDMQAQSVAAGLVATAVPASHRQRTPGGMERICRRHRAYDYCRRCGRSA